MVAELPTEVIEVLIGHIDDNQTLYSCSLTCRCWLPASRFHLFRSLSIATRTSFDILVRVRNENDAFTGSRIGQADTAWKAGLAIGDVPPRAGRPQGLDGL